MSCRTALVPAMMLAMSCSNSRGPLDVAVSAERDGCECGHDAGGPDTAGPLDAGNYCEHMAESFCGFYLRCGRVVATTPAECRAYFLETCNSRYEPYYAALVKAGLLELSTDAVLACENHLATVACDQQLHDLDGPCAVWSGRSPAGSPCGIGIESLVCDAQSSCAVGLSLCGTCRQLVPAGSPCSAETSCGSGATCLDGTCRSRAPVGSSCDAQTPCVLSATCEAGRCVAPSFVGTGETCDAQRRCRYGASCVGGTCRRDAMLGEPCGADTACASGRCAGTCQPLLEAGLSCQASSSCLSGRCIGGVCDAIPGPCFN